MPDLIAIRLGDFITVLSGFPFPSENFSDQEGTPLIRIRDLLGNATNTYYKGPYLDDFLIRPGEILVGMDGDFNVVRWQNGPALLNQRVCKVSPSGPELDGAFLFWLLGPELLQINQRTPQTTVRHLSTNDLKQIVVRIPPPSEQAKVGQILDTLDTQIRQTEALIAKLERIKQGLLTDLLTRGIDENGQLRPSPEQAPQLYKDSPLGRIPLSWESIRILHLVKNLEQGWSPNCFPRPALDREWGVLKTTAVTWKGYDESENKALPLTFAPRPELEVDSEDILITRAGPAERVGVVAHVFRTRPRLMISDKLYRLRVEPPDSPAFLALALRGHTTQRELAQAVNGMADSQTNISQNIIKHVQIALPKPTEQLQIVERSEAISRRLSTEREILRKLKFEKNGLMDDLLTGRVRVTPLLEAAEAVEA